MRGIEFPVGDGGMGKRDHNALPIRLDSDSSGVLVAYGLQNGLNFAVVTSSKDNAAGSEDGDFSAVKIGYKTGPHAFSFISGTSENPGNPVETDST